MTVHASDVVVTIRANMADFEGKMQRAGTVTGNMAAKVEQSSARVANAQRNMGRQFSDVGAQLSGGQSPFTILAQQAPQLADAMSDLGGKAGAVASFFSGPWGAALLAAASIAGNLTLAVLANDEAEQKHEKSAKSLTSAINDMTEATKGAIQTSQQAEQQHYNEAGALLVKAQNARKATVALLEAARARLQTADQQANAQGDPEGGVNFGILAGATQEAEIRRLTAAIAKQNAEIVQQGENVRRAGIPMLQRRAAEATDAAAAASGRYDRALAKLNQRFEKGKITQSDYQSQLERLNRTRDAEVTAAGKSDRAARSDAAGKRESAKAAREAARAQEELQRILERVVGKFDPLRAIALETGAALKDIDALEFKGIISSADALTYKLALARDQARAVADAVWKQQEQQWISVGFTAGDFDGSNVRKEIDREVQARFEANQKIADDLKQRQEAQIHTLAGLYESLFQGGTASIWRDFKAMGLRILAELLARWTLQGITGQSIGGVAPAGGGGNIFSSILSTGLSLFGRASGGYVAPGQAVRVNEHRGTGVELLRMGSQGGTVIPLGQASAAPRGGNTIVQQTFVLDNRYGITTPQLIDYVNSTAKAEAARAGTASYQQSMRDAPAAIRKQSRYGTS